MHRITDRADIVLGLDLGTQSCKCIILDAEGQFLGVGQQGYDLLTPRPHWVEQDPQCWWSAAVSAIRQAMRQANVSTARVQGIGVTGQMHGAVLLGPTLAPLRPAIIWMDRRSANLCPTVQGRVPPQTIIDAAGNRLSPGFAGASVAWLREVEPHILDQARVILQPKDYLVLRLTGEISSEPSDASATWLYDLRRRQWSEPLAKACGVSIGQLPPVYESSSVVGTLRADAASELGLRAEIPVVAGAADQAALLLGSGVVEAGRGSITIGTGGQITIVSSRPMIDPHLRLNTFCHAFPDRWYTMGAILNAGIALRWWRNILSKDGSLAYPHLLAAAADVPPGAEGLYFLPYLEGERTPYMNPDAKGAFVGLTLRHTQAHLTRAVLEGVAYAFRDCLLTLQETGPVPDHFLIGGGGSQGPLWRRIIANVLGVSLQTVEGREHTAVGAALLAGMGTHVFYDLPAAVAHTVRYGPVERPTLDDQAAYNEYHARFRALYPAVGQGEIGDNQYN
ncbi:MAG: xylulokinase [Chloroflexi bacterium]|nr:xylulokinase [Chloroflexota bacterium]